jgi:hypothetical protein
MFIRKKRVGQSLSSTLTFSGKPGWLKNSFVVR